MAEYNIGDKFVVEIINKTDEFLAPYISSQTKNVTVYRLKGIPFMLDADTLSNFERFEEQEKRKKGEWQEYKVIDIEDTTIEDVQSQRCSICGRYLTTPYLYYFEPYNFCPNCGADMRGKDNG